MWHRKNSCPYNEKGEAHGFWEMHYPNGKVYIKGNYVNGKREGYWECYNSCGSIAWKGVYLGTKEVGIWVTKDKEYFYAN